MVVNAHHSCYFFGFFFDKFVGWNSSPIDHAIGVPRITDRANRKTARIGNGSRGGWKKWRFFALDVVMKVRIETGTSMPSCLYLAPDSPHNTRGTPMLPLPSVEPSSGPGL